MSQTYNLGKVSVTPRGTYNTSTSYEPLDIVTYNGSSYIVLQSVIGIAPPNSTYYQLIASKGDVGASGNNSTITAGTVTMLPYGSSASVTNSGTQNDAIFNFSLPENGVSASVVAEDYSANATYSVGSYVWYNNSLYQASTNITAPESFTSSHWNLLSTGIVDELSDARKIVFESTNEYPLSIGLWRQGTINTSTGSLPQSNYACRTTNAFAFQSSGIIKIIVPSGYKLSCNEYTDSAGNATYFSRNIFDGKNGTLYICVYSWMYYRFSIAKTDDSELLLANLPNNPVTVAFIQISDMVFESAYCRKFTDADIETGKYNISTASTSSLTATVSDITGKTYTVYGVRSSSVNHGGILDDVDYIKTRGTVYLYAIGIDSTDGSVKGWYYNGSWSTDSTIKLSNCLNIKNIKANGISVKVCFVDISITTQLTVANAAQYIDVYFTPSRSALADACIEPPAYYNSMLATKSANIVTAMETAGRNSFTFMFFTDPHWGANAKQTPSIMHYISQNIGITDVVCGGDIIASQGTVAYAESELLGCLSAFNKAGITFPVSYGNHDSNWNTANNQRDYPERHLSENTVWSLMESWYDKYTPVYFTDTGFNFYVDYPRSNTRAIFLDTGDTREVNGEAGIFFTEWDSFADALMAAGNKNIIVFPHAVRVNDIGTNICSVCNSFNAKRQHTSDYLNYDFTNAQGHVYIVIGGHGHQDMIVTPETGGISYVMTDTDSLDTNSDIGAKVGTTTEQAFDVVTVDYNTGTTYMTRIGRGSNRQVPQS